MSEKKPPEERVAKVAPFGLRMLPDLKRRIDEASRANGRSQNAEIVARLERTFAIDASNAEIDARVARGEPPEGYPGPDSTEAYGIPEGSVEVLDSFSREMRDEMAKATERVIRRFRAGLIKDE